MKKIFKLYKKTTKFLTALGLNIQKSKVVELKKSYYCLTATKIGILHQVNVFDASKIGWKILDKSYKKLVIANIEKIMMAQNLTI